MHHRRLVALTDADRLDGNLGLGRFAGGGCRIDASIRGAVGQQDNHGIVLRLRAIRVGDVGELGDRNLDGGTDRRPPARPKRTQGIFHCPFVRRQRRDHLRLRVEDDETDLRVARQLVDQRAARGDRRLDPGGLHVARRHRSGDVDRQHDAGLTLGDADARLGARHREQQAGDAGDEEDRGKVAPETGALSHHLVEQRQIGEAHRVGTTPLLARDVEADQEGDGQQPEQ